MIQSLHIENYALIDRLDIGLHGGFSVITGETGAGKSIILGAIGLLLGDRADSKALKAGEKRCVVEAEFDLTGYGMEGFFEANDLDLDDDHVCIVRRELMASGKSRAFINDTPVSLAQLRELGGQLIDIHSQHQNLLLGKENFQLNVLDLLAGNQAEVEQCRALWQDYREASRRLEEAIEQSKRNQADEDYIRYQVEQLREADLRSGELEELEREQERLSHAEDIRGALYEAAGRLAGEGSYEGDVLSGIRASISALQSIGNVFGDAEEATKRLDSCYIELKDIADGLTDQLQDVEADPQRLTVVEDRMSQIYSLQKKHHVATVDELLALQQEYEEKLSTIDGGEELIAELKAEADKALEALTKQAQKVRASRMASRELLQSRMVELLVPLGMPHVRFEVEMTEKAPDASGMDKVAFLFSANKNAPLQPLSQIASGGEIARVMLSLKALIAGAVKLPTIIFDEIDTGVSGSIAEKMAMIMREMGDNKRQVISITHLPQIAAAGAHHYKVYKQDELFSTTTHIVELNRSQRIEEIAHMLSGSSITEAAISNAKALLNER